MAKNMNIGERVADSDLTTHQRAGIQKICYDNLESNCDTYGGLYNWAEAVNGEQTASGAIGTATDFNKKCATDGSGHTQGICPDGWHVPSKTELYIGSGSSGWNWIMGGLRFYTGGFMRLGSVGYCWSSSENSESSAWFNDPGRQTTEGKSYGFSVRCLLN
jgi:hypothetical protein